MELRAAPDPAAAAADAAASIARRARRAVADRGRFDLAVSGGSTPKLMFARLAELDLPWRAVHVFQVDERVAPAGHPDRNLGLLDALPLPKGNVHPMPVERADLRRAAAAYARSLPERFDLVHLGIGDDGHTASWPPGDPVIDNHAPVALSGMFNGYVRMTLTPPVVNGARARLVLIAGADKATAVAGWLLHDEQLPVERVARSHTVVVLDEAAAAQLPRQ
jgi:6-phosphogluconolactonase